MANKNLFFLIATVYWATVSLHAWAVTDELEVSSSSRAVQVLTQPDAAGTLEIRGCEPLSRNLDRSSVLWIIHNQPVKLHGLGRTGNLGVELSNLKSLKHMDLSANNIEGSFPYSLPPNLTNLNLAENKLGQSITYSFKKMKHLRHLNLGHNFLTGPLDDVLNGLENLKLMDLSFNSFTGELPTSFGSLTNLTGLFLQNNQFTGSVIFLANLSLCTGVNFTLMSVHDSPHMSAFSSSPMITPSRLPPIRTKTLKVSRRKSFSKSKTIISAKAYTVAELQIATNNFSEENIIGEGSLGRAEFPDGTWFDYNIRGCRACGLGCNFQFRRLMESMRFIGDEICYRAKYCVVRLYYNQDY
ncbi:hypothetical protein OROHE_015038 [Orobanche hederae]